MDWWNDLTDWISSDDGWRVLSGAVIPFVAIIVAGIVAALIGRGATKRVVALQEREAKNAAVSAIISAARKASTWGALGHDERAYADHLAEDADVRLRLLPVAGAPLAANWAQHELADIKKNSSTFSFQAEQSLAEFRDRLLEWQARPGRARKLFKSDLERWKFETPDPDADLIKRQQDWNADQVSGGDDSADRPEADERPTPTTTSLRPTQQSAQATTGTTTPAGAATGGPASSGAAFSVSRGATANGAGTSSEAAPTAATAGSSAPDNRTRPYSDGETTPIAPARPTLGSPTSPSRRPADDTTQRVTGGASQQRGDDADNADAVDDAKPVRSTTDTTAAPPTAADTHVNRPAPTTPSAPRLGSGPTNTTSVPTRIGDAPAEPADANETSEAPYTQPISASELRRRAASDDE